MKDGGKTKEQLMDELSELHERVRELETLQSRYRQAEERIKQQNAFLKLVVDSLPHPFYVIDVNDYTIKLVNSAARRGPLPPLTTCHSLMHDSPVPCDEGEHLCPVRAITRTKKPHIIEHLHRHADGSERSMEIHCYPVFDEDGNVGKVIEYAIDITERKKAEVEIQNLAKFPSENPYPVLRLSDDCTILYANAASDSLLRDWNCRRGRKLPSRWCSLIEEALLSGWGETLEVEHGEKTYSFAVVPVARAGYVNLYGQDITARKKAEKASQLKRLSEALLSFQEEERKRIARDLHDEIGQYLTAIKLSLGMLMKDNPGLADAGRRDLEESIQLVDTAMADIRRISASLRPAILDDFGLVPCIEHEVEFLRKRGGLDIVFTTEGLEERLEPRKEIAFYRVMQEALNNIVKHAEASRVEVRLARCDERIALVIRDDGKSFRKGYLERTGGLGIVGMRERIEAVGGTFSIGPRTGGGTIIEAAVPVRPSRRSDTTDEDHGDRGRKKKGRAGR